MVNAQSRTPASLLYDPIFALRTGGGTERASLPRVLARLLGPDDVAGFPRLAAVQRSYWYRFLVRSATRVLRSLDLSPADAMTIEREPLAQRIRELLEELARDGSAWCLHEADPTRPAFLQPPTFNGGSPAAEGYRENTLAFLTTAMGKKNHERKFDAGRSLDPEMTAYALIEFHGGAVFGGRGNYESQLMGSRSGAGSGTPFMGVRLPSLSRTFQHDVSVFLERWDEIREDRELGGDLWALWTLPWDGKSSISARELDPAFIPFSRLVRLAPPGTDGLYQTVWFKASKGSRIEDHTEGGDLGDPFTPLVPRPRADGHKVRGTLKKGYDYKEVVKLLFGPDAQPSPSVAALKTFEHAGVGEIKVVFEGTVFEQGKTGGFHRRELLLPMDAARLFLTDPDPVRRAHTFMTQKIAETKSALRGAARFLLAGSPRPRDGDAAKVDAPARALEERVDQEYMAALLDAGREEREGHRDYQQAWPSKLAEMARESFRETRRSIPVVTSQRLEREVRAEAWLNYRLRKMRGLTGDRRDQESLQRQELAS